MWETKLAPNANRLGTDAGGIVVVLIQMQSLALADRSRRPRRNIRPIKVNDVSLIVKLFPTVVDDVIELESTGFEGGAETSSVE